LVPIELKIQIEVTPSSKDIKVKDLLTNGENHQAAILSQMFKYRYMLKVYSGKQFGTRERFQKGAINNTVS